jgi:hypothetical protein
MKLRHTAALAGQLLMRFLTGIAMLSLLITSGVGVYQILATFAPGLDTSLWTLAILFVPMGSLVLILHSFGTSPN